MLSMFPQNAFSQLERATRRLFLVAPAVTALVASISNCQFPAADAAPAKAEATDSERATIVANAFVRAHAVVFRKKGSEENFDSILQPIAGDFPELKLCTEPGKVVWNHTHIKSRPVRFAAFAFKSPLDQPADLYWLYSSRESGLRWHILPAEGVMDGFNRYERIRHPHYVDSHVPVHDYVYCQSLTNGQILPGKSYIVWFAQQESQDERRLTELIEWHKKQGTKLSPEQTKAIDEQAQDVETKAKVDIPISIAVRLVPTGSVPSNSQARAIFQQIGPLFAESPNGTILYQRSDPVYSISLAPDGRSVILLDGTTTVRVLDRESKKIVREFVGNLKYSRGAISPDGKTFAAGAHRSMEISCWNFADGTSLPALKITWNADVQAELSSIQGGYEESVDVISFVGGPGQLLVQTHAVGPRPGHGQHDVVLWDVAGNHEIHRHSLGRESHDGELYDSGKQLLVTRRGEVARGDQKPVEIQILDWKTGKTEGSIPLGIGTSWGLLHLSPNGQLVSACMTRNSRNDFEVYDVAAHKRIGAVPTSVGGETFISSTVETAAWSPDSRTLALGFADASVRLWDVKDKLVRSTFFGHIQPIRGLVFTADGKFVISASEDGTVRQWSLEIPRR